MRTEFLRYKRHVKSCIEYELRNYGKTKRDIARIEAELIPSPTPNYNATGGGHTATRQTENIAMKFTAAPELDRMRKTVEAIEAAMGAATRDQRRLVELVFFKKSHSVEGAAELLHMSTATAYRRTDELICDVAARLGYALRKVEKKST